MPRILTAALFLTHIFNFDKDPMTIQESLEFTKTVYYKKLKYIRSI